MMAPSVAAKSEVGVPPNAGPVDFEALNIELGSGCAIAPDVGCTQTFSIRVEAGVISLDANELAQPVPELAPA